MRNNTVIKGLSLFRLFVYQHLPQLKYHNPDVSFKIIRNDEPPQCAVELKYGKRVQRCGLIHVAIETGQSKSINTKNSEPSDIQKEIETLVKS